MAGPPQHAVIVRLRLGDAGTGTPEDHRLVDRLGAALDEVVRRSGAGEYDGDEVGEGEAVLYLYGPDADRLHAAVDPVLRAVPARPGSHVVKRYGGPGDEGARVEVVPLAGEPPRPRPPAKRRRRAKGYEEGDWFLCPLGDGTFVPGVVARHDGNTVLASFLPRRVRSPADVDLASLTALTAADAFTHLRCSDLELRGGGWPVLGGHESWDRASWPPVEFERRVDVPGRAPVLHVVVYDDGDPNRVASERRADPAEAGRRPPDVLSGTGAAVVHLRARLEAFEGSAG